MVPFTLQIESKDHPISLVAEQMDRMADEEGFVGFDIRAAERRAVVFVNIEDQLPPLPRTAQAAEAYFEAVHYPEQLPVFSFSEDFTQDEVRLIGNAIRQHIRRHIFLFNKFINNPHEPACDEE